VTPEKLHIAIVRQARFAVQLSVFLSRLVQWPSNVAVGKPVKSLII
jgi:hypothetical protein